MVEVSSTSMKSQLIWIGMVVATCVAGMVTMATLNNHSKVAPTHTTTTAMSSINSTTQISSNAKTTTPTPTLAMLFLCTMKLRNLLYMYLICNFDTIKRRNP